MPPADLDDGTDVEDVDDLAGIRDREPGRLRIPVDRDYPDAELLQPGERSPLVPSGADEEDRRVVQRPISAANQL